MACPTVYDHTRLQQSGSVHSFSSFLFWADSPHSLAICDSLGAASYGGTEICSASRVRARLGSFSAGDRPFNDGSQPTNREEGERTLDEPRFVPGGGGLPLHRYSPAAGGHWRCD
jgi:hypothetical protein